MNRLTQPPEKLTPRLSIERDWNAKYADSSISHTKVFATGSIEMQQKGATVIYIKVKTIRHYLTANLEWFETFQNFPESLHTPVISRPIVEIVENGHDPSVDRAGQLAIVADDSLQTRIVGKCPSDHLPYLSSVLSQSVI